MGQIPHPRDGSIVLQEGKHWLIFDQPTRILETHKLADVVPILQAAADACAAGHYAAGFLSYEAASAMDPALRTRPAGHTPLIWLGIFNAPKVLAQLSQVSSAPSGPWAPDLSPAAYAQKLALIKNHIAAGDTYQVNFSFRLASVISASPWDFFCQVSQGQRDGYKAFIDTGRTAICSASPELFFRLDGDVVTCRPMKGTSPRGLTLTDDQRQAEGLRNSEKNRAENIMIVDMIRNDLGRIARPGTVETASLFDVERHETLWQMTSSVRARTSASIADVFRALFPCASVTGAPKVQTMKILSEIETSPRGIYTGAIGYMGPNRRAQFNVAIRTAMIDRQSGRAEYGTGAGIVWDSEADQEWDECLTKALVVQGEHRPFQLLETMRWDPGVGFYLLDRHLLRLRDSAAYFGFTFNRNDVLNQLRAAADDFPATQQRVRLLVGEIGAVQIERADLPPPPLTWRLAIALQPVNKGNAFLYHKTTRREIYDQARASFSEYDDVLLWNERRELTESTTANVAVQRGGELLTPPIRCGLLPGTLRAEMLEQGRIREEVLRIDDLPSAEAVFLLNSVRGLVAATFAPATTAMTRP